MHRRNDLPCQWAALANKIEVLFFDIVVGGNWKDSQVECADPLELCASTMKIAFPQLSSLVDRTLTVTHIAYQEDTRIGWASTTSVGDQIEIKISPIIGHRDLSLLAHEFSHAMHIVDGGFCDSPNVWREVVAFVGEAFFLRALGKQQMISEVQRDGVRKLFDYQYLGPRNRRLQKSLANPDIEEPRAIYPIARCCAKELVSTSGAENFFDLFSRPAWTMVDITEKATAFVDKRLDEILALSNTGDENQALGGAILKALMVPVPKDTTIKKTIAEVAISLLGAEHIGPINACDYTLTSQIPKLTADKLSWEQILTDLADMLRMYGASGYHKTLGFHKFFRLEVLPPTQLRQFKMHRALDGRPAGIISFAWLSDEILENVLETGRTLSPHEWKTGGNVFINDIYIAQSETEAFFRALRQTSFISNIRSAYGITRNPDGTKRKVRKIDLSRI